MMWLNEYLMKILLLSISITLAFNAFGDDYLFKEEVNDDFWSVKVYGDYEDYTVWSEVNGMVIHGDRLRMKVYGDDCKKTSFMTSFYTVENHPDIYELEGKVINLRNAGIGEGAESTIIAGKAIFVGEMGPIGHIVFLDLGGNHIDVVSRLFLNESQITLEILDNCWSNLLCFFSDDFKATDYFDITRNKFSMLRFHEALEIAHKKCLEFKNK